MDELKNSLKNLIMILKGKNFKNKIFIARDFLIYILVLCFLKTPIVLARDLVVDYFNNINIENILGNIFYWLFEFLYILFIILLLRNWLVNKFSANNND